MTTDKTLTPGEIIARGGSDPVFLRLPDRATLFTQRAARMDQLAIDHPMGEYLGLLARVATAQGALLNELPLGGLPLPDDAALRAAKTHQMPPLAVQSWPRDPQWQTLLKTLVARLRPQVGEGARNVLDHIASAPGDWIEDQANRILNQREQALDRGAAVFIAAALQVYWTHLTTTLGDNAFARLDVGNVCPCCGSHPVASILRPVAGAFQRYLVCSLCAAEWNYSRIKCVACGNDKDIEYLNADQMGEALKAECCPQCNTYTKLMYTDKDPHLEAVADDLASIGLDFAIADTTDFMRATINLALFPGDEDAEVTEDSV